MVLPEVGLRWNIQKPSALARGPRAHLLGSHQRSLEVQDKTQDNTLVQDHLGNGGVL